MNTGALVVLYHPDHRLLADLLRSLSEQVGSVVLVDNSIDPLDSQILACYQQVKYIHMGFNVGIAAAQNIGIRELADVEYILFLDQDSTLPSGMVRDLLQCFAYSATCGKPVAAVGPVPVQVGSAETQVSTDGVHMVDQIISSGMLASVEVISCVGGMDESLFIDAVDHEWCWRARNHGYEILRSGRCLMPHRQGEGNYTFLFVRYRLSSPVRLYYQFRNVFLLSRRRYVPLRWKLARILGMPAKMFVNSIYHTPRLQRLRFMVKGIYHGLTGLTGKYPQ